MGAQGLSSQEFLQAVARIAVEVQRSSTLSEVFKAASTPLEAMGFDVAVLAMDGERAQLRHLSARLAMLSRESGIGADGIAAGELKVLAGRGHRTHFEADVPGWFARHFAWHQGPGPRPLSATTLKRAALVSSLRVSDQTWGIIAFMHDELTEDAAPALAMLSLQLGTAIDLSNHYELLDRRTSELDLVHQLAVTGPRADTNALCHRALDLICRSTQANAGVLHRVNADGRFEMIGEPYGYSGALTDRFRRFQLPQGYEFKAPVSVPTNLLGQGADLANTAGFSHFAILPMFLEGSIVGSLTLARREQQPFSEDDLRAAEILGVQTSALLERVRLNEETERLYREVKTSYDKLAQTQAELVRHERLAALGELAAVMAHEVRNPLAVIFNSLITLKRVLKPVGETDMLLSIVGEEADRLNRIVGDLLDFVRPYELMKKPIAIEPVVLGAVDAASRTLANANVRVLTEFDRELPPFPADAHMLKQALVNLVVNAVQAMPKGGRVQVRVSMDRQPEGAWLIIEVSDEGVGLSEQAAEKMFQPFFTTKATGTGLGLAVVKRIVDGHQGEIFARPNPVGPGTRFVVRLPPFSDRDAVITTPPRARPSVER